MTAPIALEVFRHLLASVAEEMGGRLQRSAFSPNIKERRDFSCAVFNDRGLLIAHAAHIPVHLGAMPLSVQACLQAVSLDPGDMAIVNNPYQGGTHLPDMTLVAPVFSSNADSRTLVGFVANRAHHADVGGMSPGSMPLSREVFQEGLVVPPVMLVRGGQVDRDLWNILLANVRTPAERAGDLLAQIAANQIGIARLQAIVARFGDVHVRDAMTRLCAYAERMVRQFIAELPDGTWRFEDRLDDDGISLHPVRLVVTITVHGDEMIIDFQGTDAQRAGNINAVFAITLSAIAYVLQCLVGDDLPANSGCLAPIRVVAPEGTVVNARAPAAVAGGNVETAQRIVDVLLGALAQVCPSRIPAASQGTMNNVTVGGWDPIRQRAFAYYETLGGGMGAGEGWDGASAIHSHMTNTLNTPVEALEYAYPLRVTRYAIRRGSGGCGRWRGGDGLSRELEFLHDAQVTILSDRRQTQPYGLAGGRPGQQGRNVLIRRQEEQVLPGKVSLTVQAKDRLRIDTPGGGGYGLSRNTDV
ncbi:MAG: hydantoinase B/oxoprolinase family protein [Nitrospirae bacterium]|nr:MAG: hydantoinase B/oxoprolinase family protein [Nitrospirota bacterium]